MTIRQILLLSFTISMLACSRQPALTDNTTSEPIRLEKEYMLDGGSSGMEQLSDNSYLVVYDLKTYSNGIRLGIIEVFDDSITVKPVAVDHWDAEGIASDLESICAIPGRTNEFLIAEAGNWQGKLGRVFHIKLDRVNQKAMMLGSFKYPQLHRNDFDIEGDQYEGMLCFPYDENSRIVLMGERGGTQSNPTGLVRWGKLNLNDHSFTMQGEGLKGIPVSAPGDWINPESKRSITDLHIDGEGRIWAAASQDQTDVGPFYSLIYQLGRTNLFDKERPFVIFENIVLSQAVSGFKIEALSGPCKNINSTHSIGTEDEMFGGVWRPVYIKK
ncbi:MAG: hypothetical protein R2730_12155 [Chitinophagales bacterium]